MKTFLCIIILAFITFSCQKEITFENIVATLPTLTTSPVTSIISTAATSGGNITDDGGATITARGVCWSITANPTVALSTKTSDGTGSGIFTSNIPGLTATTVYYVRAYATNSEGTAYGNEISFTTTNTSTALPTVTTTSLSSVTMTSASGGGNVVADGGATVTARGVCWSTTVNPTIALSTKTTDGSGTGIFTSAITGLTAATTYHVRAYATNSVGTSYGGDSSFTTSATAAILPSVTTATISLITSISVTSGGNVTADGGATVTARGVCWSTTANPVTTGNHTTDGIGIGIFTSAITGLTAASTYHVRAYATNSVGTAYGADSTFITAPRDIYVVGYEDNSSSRNAMLWKNGVATILGSSLGMANAVFVSGNDVYVGGSEVSIGPVGFIRYAKIWKNGVATMVGNDLSEIYSIFVSGNDVYAAGYESVGTANAATIWKNGVATHISNGINNATATSVFVHGTDVYIAGTDGFGSKIWKNGIASAINGIDAPNAIYISGSDIYVAGHSNNGSTQDIAMMWKNGVSTALTNGIKYADAKSIFVSGTDVYVTGFENSGTSLNPIVAKIWKNGSEIILTGANAEGNSVTISDGNVYVAGTANLTATGIARFWKNGVATNLSNTGNNAVAYSIFVK